MSTKIRPTVHQQCEQCGKGFMARMDSVQKGMGRWCSRTCWFDSKKTRVMMPCQWCGKDFETIPAKVRDPKRGKFCGQECRYAAAGADRRPLADRFWEKVDKTADNGCWIWTGAHAKKGYGRIGLGGREGGMVQASRIAWELAHGPIPDGLFVCHDCPAGDDPRCCNPAHMFLGTNAENMADMVKKGRQRKGETSPVAILTDAQVVEMRRRFDGGEATTSELARDFGIHYQTAVKIVKRMRWRHLP